MSPTIDERLQDQVVQIDKRIQQTDRQEILEKYEDYR